MVEEAVEESGSRMFLGMVKKLAVVEEVEESGSQMTLLDTGKKLDTRECIPVS